MSYLTHCMNENRKQPPKFGSPETSHKEHQESPPPVFSKVPRSKLFFPKKDCSKYQVYKSSQQFSAYILLYLNSYILFSKTTFYRKQILPVHIPKNQYLNSPTEEVILEMPAPHHLPKYRASL